MRRSVTLCFILFWFFTPAGAQSLPRELRVRMLESVVQIVPYDDQGQQFAPWTGSGTVIRADGTILTNFHVVGNPDKGEAFEHHAVFVTRADAADQPPQFAYWAEYISGDPGNDLALLKITAYADETPLSPDVRFPAVPMGDSDDLLPGDEVVVVGYPGISGATVTFTSGLVSGWLGEDYVGGGKAWLKTDAKLAHGNSGGAAFNEQGELVGVPTEVWVEEEDFEEQAYLRPVNLAHDLVTTSRAGGALASRARRAARGAPTQRPWPSGAYGSLDVGGSARGTVAPKPAFESFSYHTYTVEVPPGTGALTVSVDGGGHDADLAVNTGSIFYSYADADYLDLSADGNPSYTLRHPEGTLYIDVLNMSDAPLPYTLRVSEGRARPSPTRASAPPLLTYTDLGTDAGAESPTPTRLTTLVTSYTTTYAAVYTKEPGVVQPLKLGQTALGEFSAEAAASGLSGGYHTYFVDVAPGTQTLSVRMNADADFDLAVKFGSEIMSYADEDDGGDWTQRDNTLSGSALLTVDAPDAGRWYIDVYNAGSDPGTYTLTAR